MGNESNIKRYTVEELQAMRERGETRSDWERVRAMTEEELERAIADDPDSDPPLLEPPEGWPHFGMIMTPKTAKKLISLRLDQEVIEHFRAMGAGYQTMMNGVLLSYVRAMKKAQQSPAAPAVRTERKKKSA
jgi:uncharacterized protein (DUF4415 family)